MSDAVSLAASVIGSAGVAYALEHLLRRRVARPSPSRLQATNYRGERLPLILGPVVGLTLAIGLVSIWWLGPSWWRDEAGTSPAWLLPSVLAVVLAGVYDDLQVDRTAGLLRHARELLRGRVTSGVVKAAAAIAAAALWAALETADPLRLTLGVAVIAGATNLWNLLDVAPARAIKFFLLASVALLAARPSLFLAFGLGTSAGVLPADLRERAMLGDAGSNTLGFVVGVALFDRLDELGLAIALVGILSLHAVSETVTLSRVIHAAGLLRWFDATGRRSVGSAHRNDHEDDAARNGSASG
jgi:UDP-GlcNAc:undecaprenyl-phosphate/decaprenyl-phosphate GlcNAc-1-phosphate transferase